MKKIFYIMALLAICLTSCTKWDDPVTENYGDGPSISIDLQAVAPTDSAFNVTLTPAAGATYYAFIIDANDVAEELDASTLLKGGYGNTVVNTSEHATLTLPITTAMPNTTYQVYAVACSDKGIVGPVANKSIKTSDVGAPGPVDADADADAKSFTVQFSEDVSRGDGKIIVTYYQEWDITNPVTVPEEELEITVDGDVLTVVAPTTPAGAFLTLSWEAGALVDGYGNKCSAFNSYLNMNTGRFVGLYFRNTLVPFEVNDTNIISPENGSLVANFEEFEGKIEMPFNIYRNDEAVEDGAVKVIYINDKKTTIHNLTKEQWSVSGKTLTFTLPVKPDAGDVIKVALAEGTIYDVCGNPNEEFMAEEVSWLFFAPTLDMILGNFSILYISYWSEDGSASSMGGITIEKNAEKEKGLLIKGLFLEDAVIEGTYDLSSGKLIIPDDQVLGTMTDEEGTYQVLFYTADGTDAATFTINPDGTLTGDGLWGIYVINVADPDDKGWVDVAKVSLISPVKDAASKAKAKAKAKKMKIHKAGRNLKKSVRK